MATFQKIYKPDLKNAQHFAFIQAFITSLTSAGFTAQKIQAKQAALVGAFAVEDQYYMQVRASEIVAQRSAADAKRDRFYGRLHRLVQAWAGSGMEGLDEAATALERVFKLYKVNVSAQMDEETGVLENLITDLSTPAMQAHIATINGTYLFQQMCQGQTDMKSLRLEQGVEQSQKVVGALASARKACDALYDELTALIEAFSAVADDPAPYDTFIRQWNGTVKLYQDMIDRKSGKGSGSSSGGGSTNGSGDGSDGDGDGGSDGGSSDNGDGGSGGDGGDTPTPNPDPDPSGDGDDDGDDTGGSGSGGSGSGGSGDNSSTMPGEGD